MSEPKYKVGDTLQFVCDPACKLYVVEVKTATCPGGTQVFYACRMFRARGDLSMTLVEMNEIEVEPIRAWNTDEVKA